MSSNNLIVTTASSLSKLNFDAEPIKLTASKENFVVKQNTVSLEDDLVLVENLDETENNAVVQCASQVVDPIIIGNPREVEDVDKPSEAQQEAIADYVEGEAQKTFGISGLQETDNAIYKDSEGNVVKQVITRENSNGEKVITTIEYDQFGRVSKVSNKALKSTGKGGYYYDGMISTFTYDPVSGSVTIQPEYAVEDNNGVKASWLVYINPIIIDKDGNRSIQGRTFAGR